MKTFTRLLVVGIALAVALGGIFGWKYLQSQREQEQMAQPDSPIAVESVRVESRAWREQLTAVGSLRAINGVSVANEVPGLVSEVAFESGQGVAQGDLLIQLEDSVDRAALSALEARAGLAEQTFQRFSDLLAQNSISRADYDEAQADLRMARAAVEEQRARLAKKTIRAPFDGVMGLRQVDLGEFIDVGTPIVDLNMLDPIQVDFSVSEKHLDAVSPGREVELAVAAFADRTFPGQILAVAPSVSETTRTLKVRAQLDNPQRRLKPGMFADVTVLADESREALVLPRTALSFNTYGDFVFRITQDDQGERIANRQQVTTGNPRGSDIEIIDGLEPDDRVVATGLLRLRDGQTVQIADDDPGNQKGEGKATER